MLHGVVDKESMTQGKRKKLREKGKVEKKWKRRQPSVGLSIRLAHGFALILLAFSISLPLGSPANFIPFEFEFPLFPLRKFGSCQVA